MPHAPLVPVPLTVLRQPDDRRRSPRRREPVTFGVPLPRGAFEDSRPWLLVDDSGRAFPVQARPLDRWPDGTVRWLLVDSQIDAPGEGATAFRLVPGLDGPCALPPALLVEPSGQGLAIDTGVVRMEIQPGGTRLFEAVQAGGRPALDPDATGLEVTDANGRVERAEVVSVDAIDRGPLRARIGIDLRVRRGALRELALRVTLDVYAGLHAVRLAVRARNPQRARHAGGFWDLGDPGSLLIRDFSLALGLPPASGRTVQGSLETDAPWTSLAAPFELYQDSSGGEHWQSPAHRNREHRVPNRFRGYRVRAGEATSAGLRATPVVAAGDATGAVAVAVPRFWQNFPKAVEANERSITLRLFPRQYGDLHELQGGEQKTHVCFVSFGGDGVTERPLDWCRQPLGVRCEPSWYLAAGVAPWLGEDDPDHAALVQSAVDGPDAFDRKREAVDEYGWRNFGDLYGDHEAVRHTGAGPLVSHYNNQYDPIAGFLYEFFRTGDPRWSTMADEMAAHVADIDIYHTDRDKWAYNHGLFWHTYHYGDADTATHRTYPIAGKGEIHGGGPSPEHTYTTGLMLHYFLTGDEASRDAATGLARFVMDADDGRKSVLRWLSGTPTGLATASGSYAYHGPGRGPANSLNSLLDGHRLTGDARMLDTAEEIIRRVVHPREDIAAHGLDEPETKWFYVMFLQSLGKYLWRKAELGQLDAMYAYGRECLLHYARWMAEHEYPYLDKPEKLTFPTETWAAQDIRKSDVFSLAALHAAGAERARFLERARFFFRDSLDSVRRAPTRTLARPVVVLLTSGLVLPWLAAHPEARLPGPDQPADFGDPVPFVPQRQLAVRRLRWITAAGGGVTVGLGLTLFWWLGWR
jgi:PcRGLX-like N-terminal RIFT barrel domain